MAGKPSRGYAMSAYLNPFDPAMSAKVYGDNIQSGAITSAHIADGTVVAADVKASTITLAKMNAAQITGAIISSGITYAVAHGLGAVPSLVVVGVRSTMALISGGATVGESSASARTSANIYLVGEPHAIGYTAYAQI